MGIGRRVSRAVSGAMVGGIKDTDYYGSEYGLPQVASGKKIVSKTPDGNPNPTNYNIIRTQQIDTFLVAEILYPDCTNYEGRKILVFEGVDINVLVKQTLIDPHFFPKGGKYKSPIARFEPTDRGWEWAIEFVRGLACE